MITFATGQSRFLTVGSLSREALQIAWQASGHGMACALNFLKSDTSINSLALLSSSFILVIL